MRHVYTMSALRARCIVICLTVLVGPSVVSSACQCEIQHPQTIICKAGWALLGKVKSTEEIKENGFLKHLQHTVKVYRVIKGHSDRVQNKMDVIMNTPAPADPCSLNVQVGLKAVFAGNFTPEGLPQMDKCSWYEDYTKFPRCQRRSLFKRLYLDNCECEICKDGKCPSSSTDMRCLWKSSDECHARHGYCFKYKGCGKCSWKRCATFYPCEDETMPIY